MKFKIGDKVKACNRLMYGTDYHPSEIALKPEQPKREPEKAENDSYKRFSGQGGRINGQR